MFQRSFSRNRFSQKRRPGGFSSRPARFGNAPRGEKITASRYVNKAAETVEETHSIIHAFAQFPMLDQIKANVSARGYTTPTPIQDQTIPPILAGRDVVGIANTGTGKTAAFLLPLIDKVVKDRAQKVLIIAPTRELATQIDDELKAFSRSLGVRSVLCIGGASMGGQLAGLRQHPNFLISTPGRLKDFVKRNIVHLSEFKTIVLDEVDRMVDIGFIHDITYIISLLPKERQSLFFSATVSPQIDHIIQSFLTSPVTISVKVQETAAGIDQDIIHVKSHEEKLSTLHTLLRQAEFSKVLIFGRTKWNVEKLAKLLQSSGFSVASIHGNKSQGQRLRVLSQFKNNQLKILVATDVAARGLDIEGVSHVINFDEPDSYTDYIHRIGRTGRAQHRGKALTFVS